MGYKWANFIMKKITLVAMAVLCSVAFCDCAAKKPVKNAEPQKSATELEIERLKQEKELRELREEARRDSIQRARQDALDDANWQRQLAAAQAQGTEVNIPCVESSFDDETYFRDLGIGKVAGNNKQSARLDAVNNAKAMIKARLGEFVQGVTSNYFNSYAGTQPSDDVQRKMETKLNGVVEKMLNDADKECEKSIVDIKGNFEYYYVVRIPKSDLKKQMTEALTADEKLGIDFNEFKMQKFMDEKMEQMLEAKKNAGY